MPDVVARQDPELLFDAIAEEKEAEPEIPKGMEFFYGL